MSKTPNSQGKSSHNGATKATNRGKHWKYGKSNGNPTN